MIITKTQIENSDGSVTDMIFIDDEKGHGYSMTKEYYDAQAANSGSSVPNDPVGNK